MKILLTTVPGIEDLIPVEINKVLSLGDAVKSYEIRRLKGRLFIELADERFLEDFLRKIIRNSGLVDNIYLLTEEIKIKNIDEISMKIKDFLLILKDMITNYTFFAIVSSRIEKNSTNVTSIQLSETLGSIIRESYPIIFPVSLDDPDLVIYAESEKNIVRLGFNITFRNPLHRRRYRRYKHPSMINPIIANALCYLGKIHYQKVVLDPMCGSGTILIECKRLNPECECYGFDINPRHIQGAKLNSEIANFGRIFFEVSDICELPHRLKELAVDAIITNPPFGVRERAKGGLYKVYRCLFDLAEKVLRSDGLLILLTSRSGLIKELLEKYKFSFDIIEKRTIIEGGLLSNIFVIERK